MQMKATSITFDRHGDSVKFRFFVQGYEQTAADEDNGDDSSEGKKQFITATELTTQELRLTSRTKWVTKGFKWKSESSNGLKTRTIVIECKYGDDNLQHSDIVRIEVFAPWTSDCDKGKRLLKAVEWAKLVVDANLKFQELLQEK
ncbi:hypothetical protein SEMRO_3234_G345710.1 [Seminavis robusta]|uniref:Uncharacterized protein n=1 Tax=Seminavis robusta TaxID=568900 RepID=A0A9N8F1E5_9STRA|nr:hypothetical protein SEMRO_3234_G345710.1 [Seminavis robusta]|eukprot:Sro3234_g345710.1 n/a (145) ;mRNA; f:2363-2797